MKLKSRQKISFYRSIIFHKRIILLKELILLMADAGEAADEAEDDDEFVFEFCDEYSALALQTKLKPIRKPSPAVEWVG